MSSTDVPIYVDVISNKQSIFFQSDPHAVILNKLAFPSLHCSISNKLYFDDSDLINRPTNMIPINISPKHL